VLARHSIAPVHRRGLFRLGVGAGLWSAVSRSARAEDYPARPVRVVVALPAGSSPDIVTRIMSQWLSEKLGQQFVVDNRPGANGNVGTEFALHAAPDGYTLLTAIAANTVNASIYQNLNFDFVRDIEPIAGVARIPQVLVVTPTLPVHSVPEFIAYAKSNPGKLDMASGGIGGTPHVAGELFKMMAGVDILHVPYRGNPRSDLLAGQVQVMFDTLPASIAFIRSGQLRALAVTTRTRIAALPDVPALAEFLPGYEATSWQGLTAPKGTPDVIVGMLGSAVDAGLADAGLRAKLANLGAVPMPMTRVEFRKLIADEVEKWAGVVKFANISPQ
jgi:tripartite-type tricarboxylate transporter receptor subunit TctC